MCLPVFRSSVVCILGWIVELLVDSLPVSLSMVDCFDWPVELVVVCFQPALSLVLYRGWSVKVFVMLLLYALCLVVSNTDDLICVLVSVPVVGEPRAICECDNLELSVVDCLYDGLLVVCTVVLVYVNIKKNKEDMSIRYYLFRCMHVLVDHVTIAYCEPASVR